MQIILWDDFLRHGLQTGGKLTSMTVGVFEGVHCGHRALIHRVVAQAAPEKGLLPVVFTFRSNDYKERDAEENRVKSAFCIQTFDERAAALNKLGVKILVVIDFTEEIRRIRGFDFLNILLEKGNIGFFAVGANFHCGYKLDTSAAAIQDFFTAHGIASEIIPEVMYEGLPVSSSRIRTALALGDIELAKMMLSN